MNPDQRDRIIRRIDELDEVPEEFLFDKETAWDMLNERLSTNQAKFSRRLPRILILSIFSKFINLFSSISKLYQRNKTLINRGIHRVKFISKSLKYYRRKSDVAMLCSDTVINTHKSSGCLISLAKMGEKAYSQNKIGISKRNERYRIWHQRQPKSFLIFEFNKTEKIGFICVLPMNVYNGIGTYHLEGIVPEFGISGNMIAKNESNLILLQGIWIDPAYASNTAIMKKFLECFYKHVAGFMCLNTALFEKTILYSEPISSTNNRFLRELGFIESNRISASGRKLFTIDFRDFSNDNDKTFYTKERILYYLQNDQSLSISFTSELTKNLTYLINPNSYL